MKVISRDNFDREIIGQSDERLIASGCSKYWAEKIAKLLNDSLPEITDRFYVAVEDDYELARYEP